MQGLLGRGGIQKSGPMESWERKDQASTDMPVMLGSVPALPYFLQVDPVHRAHFHKKPSGCGP
jgi:hypothetical protein